MCKAVTLLIALGLVLLIPFGALAWSAFMASAREHRARAHIADDGIRDDAGLTSFERVHLRQVVTNKFVDRIDADLQTLVARTRARLLLSAGLAAAVIVLLLVRTSAYCSG